MLLKIVSALAVLWVITIILFTYEYFKYYRKDDGEPE